jgi:hypothetical protein
VSEKAPSKYFSAISRQLRAPSALTAARSFSSCTRVQALSTEGEGEGEGEGEEAAATDAVRLQDPAEELLLPLVLLLTAVVAGEGAGLAVPAATLLPRSTGTEASEEAEVAGGAIEGRAPVVMAPVCRGGGVWCGVAVKGCEQRLDPELGVHR